MKRLYRTQPRKERDRALVSRIMSSVRSRDTKPELWLRAALRAAGLRFSLYPDNLPGRPDFVFLRERVVVFVDGDFWHGHQWQLRGLTSLSSQFRGSPNRAYWIRKITRNVERDAKVTRALRRRGWSVVRIWESDLKRNPEGSVRRVHRALEKRAA